MGRQPVKARELRIDDGSVYPVCGWARLSVTYIASKKVTDLSFVMTIEEALGHAKGRMSPLPGFGRIKPSCRTLTTQPQEPLAGNDGGRRNPEKHSKFWMEYLRPILGVLNRKTKSWQLKAIVGDPENPKMSGLDGGRGFGAVLLDR